MVTSSADETLCLRNLKDGVILKKMEEHGGWVWGVAVSGNSRLIASGDEKGELIARDGNTGKSLTTAIKAHSRGITSLDFSPDNAVLATVSWDGTIKLWRTDTWQIHGNPINIGEPILHVRYSPSGHLLAIVTQQHIRIWNPSGWKHIARLTAISLTWTPDGTRLLSGGRDYSDPTIQEWDTSTWEQVGDPWSDHTRTSNTGSILTLAVNSSGTLLASATHSNIVHLWRISDRRVVSVFSHSSAVSYHCVTFSVDDKYILCGGADGNITEWRVPEDALLEDRPNAQTFNVSSSFIAIPLFPSDRTEGNFAN